MPLSISRRQFLAGTLGVVGAAALGDGFLIEPTAIQVSRHDLVLPGLGPELENLRIACLSDVHLHEGVPRAAAAAPGRLGRGRPAAAVLTGAICNRRSTLARPTRW